jgi:hypothetical protein
MQGFLLVGGYGCDKKKDRGLIAKWRRPQAFDRGGGWISAVHRVMDGWRGADAGVDRAVDWIHWSMVDRAKGLCPDLI